MNKHKGTILLVDDEVHVFDTFLERAEREGYLVLPFDDAHRAIEEISNGLQYRLALLDLSIADVSGIEVARASKRYNSDAIVVCI